MARATSNPHTVLVTTTLATPVLLRVALMVDKGVALAPADARGFMCDLAVAVSVAALALVAQRLARPLSLAIVLLWVVVNFMNYEYARYFDALGELTYARYLLDPTFVRGSALTVSRPLLLLVCLAGALAPALWWPRWRPARSRSRRVAFAAGVGLLIASLVWPQEQASFEWRQTSFLHANVALWLSSGGGEGSRSVGVSGRADLGGTPIVALGRSRSNVILLIVEGISGGYLPSVARHHGASASPTPMRRLDALTSEAITYSTFIANQRQTNRGEYAVLCGDYPKLTGPVAKMTEYAQSGREGCLPALLRDAGYRTVYLQAAPLGFMLKDQFLPRIGYQQVRGHETLTRTYVRSYWGADDRAFLEQALDEVRELHRAGGPYLVTLLTVGTHHPYAVPASFQPQLTGGHARAVAYADHAVGEFVAALDAEGLLDDTLLLITSDESAGISRGSDQVRRLSQSWGLLLAMPPSGQRQAMLVQQPFAQLDIALSVVDYVGLRGGATSLLGRSVFRRYDRPRPLFFANIYSRRLYGLHGSWLTRCDLAFRSCVDFAVDPLRLFAQPGVAAGADPRRVAWLRAAADRSQRVPETDNLPVQLVVSPDIDIFDARGYQLLFGGQYFDVPANSRIHVELELTLEGEGGLVRLRHFLRSRAGFHYRPKLASLTPGSRVELIYDFVTAKRLSGLVNELGFVRLRPGRMRAHFIKATMTMSPSDGDEPGLHLRRLEVH